MTSASMSLCRVDVKTGRLAGFSESDQSKIRYVIAGCDDEASPEKKGTLAEQVVGKIEAETDCQAIPGFHDIV